LVTLTKSSILLATPFNEKYISVLYHMVVMDIFCHQTDKYTMLKPLLCPGMGVHAGRNSIVEFAKDLKADYIFWLDADTLCPSNTIERLLSHRQDIVSTMYCSRSPPIRPHVYYAKAKAEDRVPPTLAIYDEMCEHCNSGNVTIIKESAMVRDYKCNKCNHKFSKVVREGTKKTFTPLLYWMDLVNIDAIGMGCVLTRTKVFDKLEPPYFDCIYHGRKTAMAQGEDMYFSEKCMDAGIDMFCDTSVHVTGHLADCLVTDGGSVKFI